MFVRWTLPKSCEEVASDPLAVADLKRENTRSLRLTHPHIVRVHDFVEDGPRNVFRS